MYQNGELTQQDNNRCCASYVTVAMLDDIDKGFCLFAMQISSNMAKIALSFESHGSGCTLSIWDIYLPGKSVVWRTPVDIDKYSCLVKYMFWRTKKSTTNWITFFIRHASIITRKLDLIRTSYLSSSAALSITLQYISTASSV